MTTNIQKIATSDDEFEQSFFQLAYEKLQDKLNNLIPYLVGFEIVNKNEDGTRALGVFGFKSNNNQVIYVPAFFVNGTVKGIDILYSKNNEQFYPLNEDFAELFLKDDATGIGSQSHESEKKINQSVQPVDLRDLVRPPRTGKISYASVIDYVEKADPLTKKAFYEMFTNNDDYMQAVLEFYPLEKVAKALVHQKEAKVLSVPSVSVVEKGQDTKDLTPEQKTSVLTRGYALVDKRSKDQVSKFGLIKYPEKFTNPTESGFYSYLTHTGGLHYGLIIVKPLRLDIHFATDDALIIDLDAKQAGQGYRSVVSDVYTRNKFTIKDYSDVHKMMTDPAEAEPSFDDTYILLNEKLIGTQAFRIRANFKDHTGVRKLRIEVYDGGYDHSHGDDVPAPSPCGYSGRNGPIGHNTSGKATSGNFYNHPKVSREFVLVITKRPGDELERKGNEILVPKGFKLFNVHLHPPRRDWPSSAGKSDEEYRIAKEKADQEYEEEKTKYDQGKPGGRNSLSAALAETKVFPLTVRSNGSEYFVNIGAAKRKYKNAVQAKIALVLEAGLDEKTAEELVDSVPDMGKREGYIKLAYTGDYTWGIQDQQPYGGDLGQPTTDGKGQMDVWGGDQYYTKDPTQLGLAEMPEVEGQNPSGQDAQQGIQGAMSQASQLAQGGQKQIFDTHSIATLAKYVSPASKVQGYMPDFVSCLDKLGRMLFLVYWETEKFEEMYGREELPELVELLTNVFKNLGDLVIFLKRKSPEISINMEKDELSA